MAKKKSKNKNNGRQQSVMSPERFMREKARSLPIGKCYITPGWQEAGIAQILISRVRPSGNLAIGIFLVDTFCLGVKDATFDVNITEYDFEKLVSRYKSRLGFEEIGYDEAHNIIYGAISFAEEGGVRPVKDFVVAGYILEEDTEDVPLIEYEFGKNGKHFLVINPDRREMHYVHTLRKALGDDFEYVINDNGQDDDLEDEDILEDEDDWEDDIDISLKDIKINLEKWEQRIAESASLPKEEYSYDYPDYPQTLSVRHQFIADELMSSANYAGLSDDVIGRILALPADEVAEDISNIILYEIGKTYKAINEDTAEPLEESAIMHSLILLAQLDSEKGLGAVLEIMRQNGEFADYHLGDIAPELLPQALYACGRNNIPAIEEYLYQPGLDSYLRPLAFEALAMVVVNNPDRREEIIEVFRRLLNSYVARLPKQDGCDGEVAGFVMGYLMDISAKELIPEIKAVFDTGFVDKTVSGDCEKVVDEIESERGFIDGSKYEIPDVYKQYADIRKWLSK